MVHLMVHLQLRVCCSGVAEVKRPINEACVKMAELLAYKLKILKFQGVADLKTQMGGFEGDANHPATLVLVTGLLASTGRISSWPHSMILCYNTEEQSAAESKPSFTSKVGRSNSTQSVEDIKHVAYF